MSNRPSNACRKLASNIANTLALGIAALSVLRPIFDPTVAFVLGEVALAILTAVVLWLGAFYVLSTLEDEE